MTTENTLPDFSYEKKKLFDGYKIIAGVDEVGRGPWAGPVVAAAVILDTANLPYGVTDSKKLSAKKRQELSDFIAENAIVGIGQAEAYEIDELNIRQATFLAMERAVQALGQDVDFLAIDGNDIPDWVSCKAESIKKGDAKVMSIAAASVIAKVYRDTLMNSLADQFPGYAWDSNAGYGTKAHQEGLASLGVCDQHRKSFKPIKAIIEAGQA